MNIRGFIHKCGNGRKAWRVCFRYGFMGKHWHMHGAIQGESRRILGHKIHPFVWWPRWLLVGFLVQNDHGFWSPNFVLYFEFTHPDECWPGCTPRKPAREWDWLTYSFPNCSCVSHFLHWSLLIFGLICSPSGRKFLSLRRQNSKSSGSCLWRLCFCAGGSCLICLFLVAQRCVKARAKTRTRNKKRPSNKTDHGNILKFSKVFIWDDLDFVYLCHLRSLTDFKPETRPLPGQFWRAVASQPGQGLTQRCVVSGTGKITKHWFSWCLMVFDGV